MKKLGLLLGLLPTVLMAESAMSVKQPLDKIAFQVSNQAWVTTKTALLRVTVNATLTNADLVKARQEIMERLNTIAKGDWHLTHFDRSQDNSGLEKLSVEAEARVDQASLTGAYEQAKSVSRPGESYKVATIEFKPSLSEVQQVKASLRDKLYQQAQDEVARINKVYPDQHFSIYRLVLVDGDVLPQEAPQYKMRGVQNLMAMSASAAPLTVSNELKMTALVKVASNRPTGG